MASETSKLSMLTPDEIHITEPSKGSASQVIKNNDQGNIRMIQPESQHDLESEYVPRSELEHSRRKCDTLNGLVEKLQQDLEEAHSLIFSLQPSQPPMTDTEAARDFKTLLTSVEQWVDTKISLSSNRSWSVGEQKAATLLLDLVTAQGRSAFICPGTDEYNIIAVIMRFLYREFFSTDFYGPLSGAYKSFLSRIEHNMSQLDPPRDLRTRRTWHSETFTAIANGPGFRDRVETMNRKLANDLFGILQVFITSTAHTDDIIDGLYENIIKRAYILALKMHLSVDDYTIQWSDFYDSQPNAHIVIKDLDEFELLDLQRGRTVTARPPQVRIQWLFDVTPKLSVRKVLPNSYAKPKLLIKPRILVIAKEKTGSEKNEIDDLYSGQYQTVLGMLDKANRPRKIKRGGLDRLIRR